MKIAVLCDTHFGARGDSESIILHQKRFFDEVFFPEIDRQGIKTLIHLGDVFDREKYVNFNTLDQAEEFFFTPLQERGIKVYSVIGNHDTYFKNKNDVNAQKGAIKSPNWTIVHDSVLEIALGSTKFCLVPWINKNNRQHILDQISKSTAHILAGHFEFKGFEYERGTIAKHGMDHTENGIPHFSEVWSGHYHEPSSKDNVEYLGAPYEMRWSDYNGWRGFTIFDCNTRQKESIENPHGLFHVIDYDDTGMKIEEIDEIDVTDYKDCYVKIVVKVKNNPFMFEKFIEKFDTANAADVKIIESNFDFSNMEDLDAGNAEENEMKDTKVFIMEFVELSETKADKDKAKAFISKLYEEAISL